MLEQSVFNNILDIYVYILGGDISSMDSGISFSPVLKDYLNENIFKTASLGLEF